MKNKITLVLVMLMGLILINGKVVAQRKGAVVNHIAYYVLDLKKSTEFYRVLVGIDTIPEPFHDGKHTWFTIGGQAQLHLIQGAIALSPHDKNTHICFSVVSIEDFIARLDKRKIEFTNWKGDGKTPTLRVDGVKQIYLQDPDGYWIEINNATY